MPRNFSYAVEDTFGKLLALEMDQDDDGSRPMTLLLSIEGKEAWVRFFTEHAAEHFRLTGALAAAWSKLRGLRRQFALVY